jgi:hypothetical protein
MSNFIAYKGQDPIDFDEVIHFWKYESGSYYQIKFMVKHHNNNIVWTFQNKKNERDNVYEYLYHKFVRNEITLDQVNQTLGIN